MENSQSQNGSVVREIGGVIAGGYGDHQEIRKSTLNRIRDVVRRKNEGIPLSRKEEKKPKTYDSKYKDEKLTGLVEEMFKQNKLTKEERNYLLKALRLASQAASLEQSHKSPMRTFIANEPVWKGFLYHIPGIAEVLGAKLVANFGNCERYKHVSSIWRHCGLHLVCPKCTEKVEGQFFSVVADVNGKCPECGLAGVSPKRKKGQKLDFDLRRRSLVWNIGKSLVKQKSPVYYGIYETEKKRQLKRKFPKGKLKKLYGDPYEYKDIALKLGHADNRGLRKMIKVFLQHYWVAARELNGEPLNEPYVQAKLGHNNIATWKDVLAANEVEEP